MAARVAESQAHRTRIDAGIGDRLGALVADQSEVAADVEALAARFILDTLGLIAGGAKAPGIREFARALRALEPAGGLATSLIDGLPASPVTAAMINSAAGHALDFDDTHDAARVHAFCVVVPAGLSAAELVGEVTGADFACAVTVGAELFCRLGLACPHSLAKGWHPTATFGALAAAATAAKILRLDAAKTANALAIAYVQMAGTSQSIIDGALTKRLGAGFAARNGLTAAVLAKEGLTGPRHYLDGKAGLFNLYERGEVTPDIITSDFGTHWELRALSMKPYPCCRCSHSLVQIGVELHNEGLTLDDVAGGELLLGKLNHDYVGAPFNPRGANDPVVHAQFNACYAFSQALMDGKVDCATFTRERILSPKAEVATRFRSTVSPRIEAGAMSPAHVRLLLKDGSEKTASKETMKGSPQDPLTDAEVLAKFAANLQWGLQIGSDTAGRLGRQVLELKRARNVAAVAKELGRQFAQA